MERGPQSRLVSGMNKVGRSARMGSHGVAGGGSATRRRVVPGNPNEAGECRCEMIGRIMAVDEVRPRVWERWKARRDVVVIMGAAAVYALLSLSLLARVPPAQLPEAYFAQASLSLVRDGVMASPGLATVIPSFGEHTFWQPPAYFLAVAADFKLLGFGLVQLRLLSVCMALVAVGFWFLSLRRVVSAGWIMPLAMLILVTDASWLEVARLGRMEAMTMAGVMSGAYCYLRSLETGPRSLRWAALAGTLAAVAWLTHPFGLMLGAVIGLNELLTAILRRLRSLSIARLAALVVPSMVGCLAWLVYVLQDTSGFSAQMAYQFGRKGLSGAPERAEHFLSHYHPQLFPLYLLYSLLAGLALIAYGRRRDERRRFLALLFFVGVAMAIYGADLPYLGYIPLYGVGSLALLAGASDLAIWPKRLVVRGFAVGAALLLLANLAADSYLIHKYRFAMPSETDHASFAREVNRLIPDDQRIMLATAVVTPYFEMARGRDLRDLMLPLPNEPEGLERQLASSDYVVLDYRGGGSLSLIEYPEVGEFIETRGELVGEVGYECADCILFRVWKVMDASVAPEERTLDRSVMP